MPAEDPTIERISGLSQTSKDDSPDLAPPRHAPVPPTGAVVLFGDRMPLAVRFVEILTDTGVSHGLVGPREVPRLWDRHVLNCAVVEDSFPTGAEIIDVGSGAGLPGIALALVRSDLTVRLIEPMLRRTSWLDEVVRDLGLKNVTVHRGRAEEFAGSMRAPWVTARAVARLGKLARWCSPLLSPGGTLVALKGRSVDQELEEDRAELAQLGVRSVTITEHGQGIVSEPVRTVDLTFAPPPEPGAAREWIASDPRAQRRGARGRRRS